MWGIGDSRPITKGFSFSFLTLSIPVLSLPVRLFAPKLHGRFLGEFTLRAEVENGGSVGWPVGR